MTQLMVIQSSVYRWHVTCNSNTGKCKSVHFSTIRRNFLNSNLNWVLSKCLCKTTLFPFNLLRNGPQGMCLLLFIPLFLQYCFFCMSHLSGLFLKVSVMTIFACGMVHSQVWQNELLRYSVSWDLTPSFQRVTASYSTEVVRGGEEDERERERRENNFKKPTKLFVSFITTK